MSNRKIAITNVLIIAGLLLFSVYLQLYKNLLPCPLCTIQRITFFCLGISFILSAVFVKRLWQRIFFSVVNGGLSLIGIIFAGRQVWLQHFPNAANDCGATLNYMLQIFSWNELLAKILEGGADCSKVTWEFLHVNMAEWALIWFFVFFIISIYLLLREIKFN